MTYHAVDEVVRRTRRRVGFHFTAHQLRHTYATTVWRGGVPVEIVSKLLCHRSVQTTSDIYLHASPEDLRAELERAGVLTTRTALVILIETGLRSVDCLRLPFDPVTTDEAGAPCLRFWRGGWPTAVSATPRANQ